MEGVFRPKKNTNIAQPTIKSKNLIRNPFKENSELKTKNREELSKNKLINNKSLSLFPKEEIRSKITIRQAIQTQTNHSKTPSIISGIIDNKENNNISETTKTVIIKKESKEIIRETKIASTLNNGKIEKLYIMNNNNTTSNKNSTTMKFVNQVIERKKAILETKPDYSTVTSTDKNKILEKFKVKIALNNKYKQFFDQKETVKIKKGVSSITIDKTNLVNNEEKLVNDVNESFISVASSSINESFIFSRENKEKSSKVEEDINDNVDKKLKVKEYQTSLEMEKKKNYFKLRNLDNKENKEDFKDIHANERGGKIPFEKETNYNKVTKDTKEDPTEQRCRLSDNENKNQTNTQEILENLDNEKPDEESFFIKRIKFIRKIKTLQRLFRIKYNKKKAAIIKIQKVYKGYIIRRNLKPILSKKITISLSQKPIVKEKTKLRRLPYMTEKEMNRSLFSKSLSVDPIKNSDIVKKLIKSFVKKKKNQVIIEKETPNKVFIRDLKKTALLTNEKLLNYYKVINNNNEEINQTNIVINNNLDRVKYYNDNYYRNNHCLDEGIPIAVLNNENENKVNIPLISKINTNISVLTKTSTNFLSNNNKIYFVQSQYKQYKQNNALKEESLKQKNKKHNFTLENSEYEIIEKQVKPMRIMSQTQQPFIINKINKVKPNLFLLIRLQLALRKKLLKIRQEKLDNEKEKERTQKSAITLNVKKLPKRLPETMIYTYFTKNINADQTSKMLVIQKTFKSKFAHKIKEKDEQKQATSLLEEIKETKEVINTKPIINNSVVLTKVSKKTLSKISYVIYIQRLFKTKLMKRLREKPEKIVETIKEEKKLREKKLLFTNNVFTKESKINIISNIELIQNNYKNKVESKRKPLIKEEVSIYESATEYQNVSNFFTQTKKKLVIDTNCYFHKSNKAKILNEDKIKIFQILFKKKLEKEKREKKKEKKAPTQDELICKLKELNNKLIITSNNNEMSLNDEFMFTPEIKEIEEQEKTYRSKKLYIDNCIITKTSSLNYNQKITQKIVLLQEEGKDYINRLRLSNENKKERNVICLENNTEILHNEECKKSDIMVTKKKPLITFKGNADISSFITKKIKVITPLAEEKLIVVQKSFKLSKKNTKKDSDDNTNIDDGFTTMEFNNQPTKNIMPSAPEKRIMRTANSISNKPFICNKQPTCKPTSTLKKLINLQRAIKWKMLLIKSKKQLVLNSIRNKVIISRQNNQCIYNEFTKKPSINLEKLNTRANSIQQSYKYYLNEKNNKLEKSEIENRVTEEDHPVKNKIIIKDTSSFTKAIKNCNTSKITIIQKEVKDRLERRARLDDEYNKNLNDISKIEMNNDVDQINVKKINKKNKILPAIYISKEYRADLNKTVENLQVNIVEYILTKPDNKNLRLPNKRSSLKQVINNNSLKSIFEQEYINTSINIQKQKQNDINHEKGIDFSISPPIKEKTFSKVNNVPYVSIKINKRNSLYSLLLVNKIQRIIKKKLAIKKALKAEEEKLLEDKNILIAKTRNKIHNINLASCIISKKIRLNTMIKIVSLQSSIKQHLSNKDTEEIENIENKIMANDNQIENLDNNQIIKKTTKKLLNNNICYFTKEHKSTIGNINSIKNIQKKFRSRNATKKKEYYRATTGEYTFETIPENNINSTFFNNNKEVLEKSTVDKVNEKENQLILAKPKITEALYNKSSKPRFNINKILYLQKLVRIFFNNKKKQESKIRTKVIMNYNKNIHKNIIYKTNRNNVLLEKTIMIQNNIADYNNNKRVRLQKEKAKNSIIPSYNDNYEIIKEKPIIPIKPIPKISQKPYEIVKKNSCKPSLINLVKLQRKFKLRLNDLRNKNQKEKEQMDLEDKISNEVKDTKPKKLPLRYNSFYATKNHVADINKHKILIISKVKNWIDSFPKHDTTIYTEYATSNIENIRTPIKDNSNNHRDKSRNSYNLVITKEKETFINQSKSRDPSKDEILKQSKEIYNITTIKAENKLPIKKPKNYLKFYATKNQKAVITNSNVMTIIKNVKHFHSKYIKKRVNANNRSQSYFKNEQDKNSNLSLTYSDIRLNLENKILKEKLHTTTYKKIYKTPICINKDININVNRKILNRKASIIQKMFRSYTLNRNGRENLNEISNSHQDCVFSQVNTQGIVYTKEVYLIENDKVDISSDSLIKGKELQNMEKEEIISKHFISSFIITKKPKMCMNNINNNIQKLQTLYRNKKQTENIKPVKKNTFEQLIIDNNESSNIYKSRVLIEDKPARKILYKLPNCYFSKTATVLPVSGMYGVQRLYRNYISNKNDKLLLNQTHDDTSYLTKNDRTTSNISHVFAPNNQPEPVLINKPFIPCAFTKINKQHIKINEPAIKSLQVRFRSSRKKANNLKETKKLYKDLNSLVKTIKRSSLKNVFDDLKDYQINDICRENLRQMFSRKLVVDISSDIYYISVMKQMSANMSCFLSIITERKRDIFTLLKKCYKSKLILEKQNKHHLYLESIFKTNTINMIERINRVNGLMLNKNIDLEEKKSNTGTDNFNVDFYMDKFKNDELMLKYVKAVGNMSITELRENDDKEINNI